VNDRGSKEAANIPTVRIGDVDVHNVAFADAVELIWRLVEERRGLIVCTPNADHVVRARRDPELREAIAAADLRVPDGMGIVYASRIAGRPINGTVTGRLLLPALAARAADAGVPLTLFGAQPGIAARAAGRLAARYPGLTIGGAISPPHGFVIGSADDARAVAALRSTNPRLLFVALGAPKQEVWMQRHRPDFETAVMIGVGGAFDIVAGRFREAPRWMTAVGMEWLFRLAQEPRRLARRYLIDDPWIIRWAFETRLRSIGARLRRGDRHHRDFEGPSG
jgi:N-acetylglucosaminyldiphosphoundecaprenol N-acetyl-beta-D-mannosaminyltransferase